MDHTQMSFSVWMEIGLRNGFVGPPVCYTHDGLPMTDEELELWDNGEDICIHVIRPYESSEHKTAIEDSHAPSVWRNPLCAGGGNTTNGLQPRGRGQAE